MKRINTILIILIVTIVPHVGAQTITPLLWLRADSTSVNGNMWQDISGNNYHAVFSSHTIPTVDSLVNYNLSFYFEAETILRIPQLQTTESENSFIVVYQLNRSDSTENPLWQMQTDSSHFLGLTTQRILNDQTTIRYGEDNVQGPIVNSLSQLWRKNGMSDTLICRGQVGSNDTATFNGCVAEIVVLPIGSDYTDSNLIAWYSYLAVKYGVTLKETSYLSSGNKVIWCYDSLQQYSQAICGIGRDDAFGLYQKQSTMNGTGLSIAIDSVANSNTLNIAVIANDNFLMVGCDIDSFRTATDLYLDNDLTVSRYGDGLVKVTGNDFLQNSTVLQMNDLEWQDSLLNYVLLIDRSGTGEYALENVEFIFPSEVDTNRNMLFFNDIYWDVDRNGQDVFCFAPLSIEDLSLLITPRGSMLPNNSGRNKPPTLQNGNITLYPNPNDGHFVLEATYPIETQLLVRIYSVDGKVVKTMECTSASYHRVEGTLAGKGQYLLEIISNEERNVVKMVVQ